MEPPADSVRLNPRWQRVLVFFVALFVAIAAPTVVPWCRVTVTPSRSTQPTGERLSHPLREIGVQGVTPISAEEKDIYDQGESVEGLLATLKAAPGESTAEARQLRAYYCPWTGHNGTVVPAEIRRFHESSFRWLACT
jgi:hypothetical protein